jgi:Luciferase-like monooxygenase
VICNSYRNPNLLADMARTIDHISGGRFMRGIGSGWFQTDYDEYGYEFGTAGSRPPRSGPGTADHQGALEEAEPSPAPPHPDPDRRRRREGNATNRGRARHVWHAFGGPAAMKRKSDILDDWCAKVGRDPAEIQRSTTISRLTGESRDADAFLELG